MNNSRKKGKLTRFAQFANSLLPHEVQHLLKINRLADPQKVSILQRIASNTTHPLQPVKFDETIDKRKYSYLKNWIVTRLKAIDADYFYEWLINLDRTIMTDSITLDQELNLISAIKKYRYPTYYFIRFYELVQNYRYYLLIRMRYQYNEIAGQFLDRFRNQYLHAKNINQQLHEATIDIVSQYSHATTESKHWEEWLISVFNDTTLDGLNRYFAIVRLTFLYYNYKRYNKLIELYNVLDKAIIEGEIYSRRILVNYYANRVLLHSRYNEPAEAELYGWLSIRHKGSDYLYYVNNLCAVLLRNSKTTDALALMKNSFYEFRGTLNAHTRIGFVSYYMQCLNRNGKAKEALNYAKTFFAANRQDIIMHRWHIFFTTMIRSMLLLEQYRSVLAIIRRNHLEQLVKEYKRRVGFIPAFLWYYAVARYKECEITEKQLRETIICSVAPCLHDDHSYRLIMELCSELQNHAPGIFGEIRKELETQRKSILA